MAQGSRAELDKSFHLGVVVVYAVDHSVFVRRTTPRLLNVLLNGLVQARQRVFLNAGHQLVAGALNGGVQ